MLRNAMKELNEKQLMKISEHISYNEATRSQTALRKGIDNTPDAETLARMKEVADNCFEPLREWYGKPIRVNSFYRSEALNTAVGGSKTSQHVKGEAIDIDTNSDNEKLFNWCKENLDFDQLIWEYGGRWIHISYKAKNRMQVLSVG